MKNECLNLTFHEVRTCRATRISVILGSISAYPHNLVGKEGEKDPKMPPGLNFDLPIGHNSVVAPQYFWTRHDHFGPQHNGKCGKTRATCKSKIKQDIQHDLI